MLDMDIQIVSDIHLEFLESFPIIERKSKYLILAGDIGRMCNKNYKAFINYCSQTWLQTIVILGNHEFYHNMKTYNKLLNEYIDFFSQFDNVTLLEKEKIMLEDWEIIGLTMWGYIRPVHENMLNSSKHIKKHIIKDNIIITSPIGNDGINKLYGKSLEWLLNNYDSNKKTIIITHYPLTHDNISMPEYENQSREIRDAFATDIIFKNTAPLICISGHTHLSYDFIKNNVRYISNQMGYQKEFIAGKTKFNPDRVYTILTHNNT